MTVIGWETDFVTFKEGICAGEGINPDCDYIEESWFADHPEVTKVPGKQYFGRGPKQLSWNYNYGTNH